MEGGWLSESWLDVCCMPFFGDDVTEASTEGPSAYSSIPINHGVRFDQGTHILGT